MSPAGLFELGPCASGSHASTRASGWYWRGSGARTPATARRSGHGRRRALRARRRAREPRRRRASDRDALAEAVELETVGRTDSSAHVLTLSELANAHFYAGHYEVADSLNRAVLAIDRRLHGARHPNVASDLANLGYAQRDWGHPAEAERYFREALAIYRGWYGRSTTRPPRCSALSGRSWSSRTAWPKRASRCGRRWRSASVSDGPDHLSVATLLDENAWLDEREGRFAEAEAGYQRELRIVRAAYHEPSPEHRHRPREPGHALRRVEALRRRRAMLPRGAGPLRRDAPGEPPLHRHRPLAAGARAAAPVADGRGRAREPRWPRDP